MVLLLFYFALAIGVSFLCSILEAVFLSLTPSYVATMEQRGTRAGRTLAALKADVDRPLAAILSLNTIAHTVGAAGVGAQAQVVFQSLPVAVISGVLTLLILVLSEIIPKTLGASFWRQLAVPAGYTIQFLIYTLWPLVVLSQGLTRLLTRGEGEGISREEISSMADLGHRQGVLAAADAAALRGVLEFRGILVRDVLTPRVVVASFSAATTVREAMEREDDFGFSRYPLIEEGETIGGYVLRSDILKAAADDAWDTRLGEFARKVPVIPVSMTVKRAFTRFLRHRDHLAVVVDEFGGVAGVLTLEDVIETLIGHEIMDEGDDVEDLRAHARESGRQAQD